MIQQPPHVVHVTGRQIAIALAVDFKKWRTLLNLTPPCPIDTTESALIADTVYMHGVRDAIRFRMEAYWNGIAVTAYEGYELQGEPSELFCSDD
jgi:hypothetical protein